MANLSIVPSIWLRYAFGVPSICLRCAFAPFPVLKGKWSGGNTDLNRSYKLKSSLPDVELVVKTIEEDRY